MGASDAMLARLQTELDERCQFQEGLIEAAQTAGRDLNSNEMELYNRAAGRIAELEAQLDPLREGARIAVESRRKSAEIQQQFAKARGGPANIEYRSAGAYIADRYYAQLGDTEAQQRMEAFNRVAAHQTTADNPGLLPENIVAPVINIVEASRPITSTLGPTDLGSGAWAYATVTQHTQVGLQAGEKTELASRKMLITKTPLGADTYGGYVNVSKQDINRTSPAILDMIINDLAGQYAIETEEEAADVLWTGGTGGPILPAAPTADDINTAIWGAAGSVFAATKGQGRTIVMVSPDMLGVIGPILGAVSTRPTCRSAAGSPPAASRRAQRHHQRTDREHERRSRYRADPRVLDGCRQSVRIQVRQHAGCRAVGVGRAGGLRRRFRLRGHRACGRDQDHEDAMSTFDDPNREAVGLAPIWTGAGDAPPPEGSKSKAHKAEPKHEAGGRADRRPGQGRIVIDVTAPAENPWDLVVVTDRALAVLRLDPDDADAGRVLDAAAEAVVLVDAELDLPVAYSTSSAIPMPVVSAAVNLTVEGYRRKDAPFGVTDSWSADGAFLRLSADVMKGVKSQLRPFKARRGVA